MRVLIALGLVLIVCPAFSQFGYWTWTKGDSTINHFGIYGTQGTPSPANLPGSRSESMGWTDTAGNLWLFGGHGNGASTGGYLNDLWKYNTTTNQWAYIKGNNFSNSSGSYGTQG